MTFPKIQINIQSSMRTLNKQGIPEDFVFVPGLTSEQLLPPCTYVAEDDITGTDRIMMRVMERLDGGLM